MVGEKAKVEKEKSTWDIVLENEGLVGAIVKKYRSDRPGVNEEDLYQEGLLGLKDAIERYDPSKGALSTYAYFYIESYISRYFNKNASAVHISNASLLKYRRVRRAVDGGASFPFALEAGEMSETDYNMVDNAYNVASLESPARSLDGEALYLKDFLVEGLWDTPRSVESEAVRDTFGPFCFELSASVLTEREKLVVLSTVLDEETLEVAGAKLGVTRERVRQIQAKALRKLRHYAGKHFEGGYDRVYYEE